MASNPKTIKHLSGAVPNTTEQQKGDHPVEPYNLATAVAAILQLQNTVNELIVRHNSHTHLENTAGAYAQNATTGIPNAGLVTGAAQAASTKFTDN